MAEYSRRQEPSTPNTDTRARGFRPRAAVSSDDARASLRQLIPYLFEQRGLLALALTFGVVGAATSLVQPVLLGQVIERVQLAQPLGVLLTALSVLVAADALLAGLQHYVLQRMGEGVVLQSRRRLIARIFHLPISEFDQRSTGDLVSRVGSDTTLLRAVLTQGLVEALSGMLVFFGALIGMLVIDPVLLSTVFFVVAVALIIVILVSAKIRPAVTRVQQQVGNLTAKVERSISSIRTIRAVGATEREAGATVFEAETAYRLGVKVAKISAFIVPVSFLAFQVSFLVVLGLGGYRVATGAIGVAHLVMFIVFLFLMVTPFGQAFGAIAAVNQALGALGRIQEIVALADETEHDLAGSPAGRIVPLSEIEQQHSAHRPIPAISFDHVTFSYRSVQTQQASNRQAERARFTLWRTARAARGADVDQLDTVIDTVVLEEVSFDVPQGARIALVGPSGAGKSTILALIERFYDPDSGSIALLGADLRTLDRAELRSRIGYVEQDAPVLAGTLRDNLLLGVPHASDAECERVLRAVNLGALLERAWVTQENTAASKAQHRGLDTQVGERGVMLSGGEKQRLAIARTLLAAPAILLLDESTASLDSVNERLMREALDSVATGRTLVVVAHRLSTVIDSDRIIVLDQGRVVGEGTHDQLIDTVPLYRELAAHQLLVPETRE